jgi:large subunit ribosomal protein L10
MNKQQKIAKLDMYQQAIADSGFQILTEFSKIPVTKMEAFRSEIIGMGGTVLVLKNTLAKIAFERNGIEQVAEFLAGTSLLFAGQEEIAPMAKAIQAKAKEFRFMKVKAIVFDGKVYGAKDFAAFTSMPTKSEIRSKLLGVFKAPVSNFVRILSPAGRLVTVLGQYAEKRAG